MTDDLSPYRSLLSLPLVGLNHISYLRRVNIIKTYCYMGTFLIFLAMQLAALALRAQSLSTSSSLQITQSQASDSTVQFLHPTDTVDYNLNLGELVVKATMPKTKMKNGALVTRIEGSVLESAGTAEEMLVRVPGMMRRGGVLQGCTARTNSPA